MQEVERKSHVCRVCGTELRHKFVSLGSLPLANAYLAEEALDRDESRFPLDVYVCSDCLLVQLPEWESPENIFADYAYFSSYSTSWLAHAERYVREMVDMLDLDARSQVVEIASNDGYLLQYFLEFGIPVLGIEPARNVAEVAMNKGIPTETAFFCEAKARDLVVRGLQADLVVANNVLAHVPQLNDVLRGLAILLKDTGVVTVEFPHLMRLIEGRQFDTIYHEHFSYFSLIAFERACRYQSLRLYDVQEHPTHGGSLRVFATRSGNDSHPETDRLRCLRSRELEAGYGDISFYTRWMAEVEKIKRGLLAFLQEAAVQGKQVAAYGAAAKGNTLLNCSDVGSDLIRYVVDKSPHKQGRFLPGSHIPIVPPSRLRETKPDYVIILPWNICDEVAEQVAYIREWGGRFVTAIPELRIF